METAGSVQRQVVRASPAESSGLVGEQLFWVTRAISSWPAWGAEKRGSVMRTGFERILYSFGNGLVFYLESWLIVKFGLVENL